MGSDRVILHDSGCHARGSNQIMAQKMDAAEMPAVPMNSVKYK